MLKQATTATTVIERSYGRSLEDTPSPRCVVQMLSDVRMKHSERKSGCLDERLSDVNVQLVDFKNVDAGNNRTNCEAAVVWLCFVAMTTQKTVIPELRNAVNDRIRY